MTDGEMLKNIALATVSGLLIWLLRRFVESTEKLREVVEAMSKTMDMMRVEIERDHPKRAELKESIKEHIEHHVEVYHPE